MISLEQYRAVHEGAGWVDRSNRGRLRLTGSDRRSYLHGLLTNDIAALTSGRGCYAALLTPQGRMISDMRVSEVGEAILLDLPGHTSGTVRQRLSDFIFSEDVEVADVSRELAHLALYGPRSAGLIGGIVSRPELTDTVQSLKAGPDAFIKRLADLPPYANASLPFDGVELRVVRSDDYGVDGYEMFVAASRRDELVDALRASGADDVALGTMEVCRIEGGRPEFGIDMDEHTIPLEAGIEDRAISLTKGCYVGQEIIIRVLHRGHGRVAKHLVGFVGRTDEGVLARGDRLLTEDGGREVGSITSGVESPRLKRPIGLGYVQRDHAEPGTILSVGRGGAASRQHVTVVTLPFTQPASR